MARNFDQVKTPFSNMTWTPDVPPSALQANEYSGGLNVETDVRGIRSVFGDENILTAIPDRAIYVTSGNLLFYDTLPTTTTVQAGANISFGSGNITVTCD